MDLRAPLAGRRQSGQPGGCTVHTGIGLITNSDRIASKGTARAPKGEPRLLSSQDMDNNYSSAGCRGVCMYCTVLSVQTGRTRRTYRASTYGCTVPRLVERPRVCMPIERPIAMAMCEPARRHVGMAVVPLGARADNATGATAPAGGIALSGGGGHVAHAPAHAAVGLPCHSVGIRRLQRQRRRAGDWGHHPPPPASPSHPTPSRQWRHGWERPPSAGGDARPTPAVSPVSVPLHRRAGAGRGRRPAACTHRRRWGETDRQAGRRCPFVGLVMTPLPRAPPKNRVVGLNRAIRIPAAAALRAHCLPPLPPQSLSTNPAPPLPQGLCSDARRRRRRAGGNHGGGFRA